MINDEVNHMECSEVSRKHDHDQPQRRPPRKPLLARAPLKLTSAPVIIHLTVVVINRARTKHTQATTKEVELHDNSCSTFQ